MDDSLERNYCNNLPSRGEPQKLIRRLWKLRVKGLIGSSVGVLLDNTSS